MILFTKLRKLRPSKVYQRCTELNERDRDLMQRAYLTLKTRKEFLCKKRSS